MAKQGILKNRIIFQSTAKEQTKVNNRGRFVFIGPRCTKAIGTAKTMQDRIFSD